MYTAQSYFVFRGLIVGGLGQHTPDLSMQQVIVSFKAWYFGELLYALVSVSVRTSVALTLLGLYNHAQHRTLYMILLLTCLGIVGLVSLVFFFASMFQCSPPTHYWKQFEDPTRVGTCANTVVPTTAIVLSVVAAVSDLILAVFPMARVWNASLSQRKGAFILMSLGLG